MSSEEPAQIFVLFPRHEVTIQQTLDSVRDFCGRAAISHRTRNGLMQANRAANAEVIGVDELPVLLDLLALKPEIGDPVLAATVGASGDVQLEMLLEARQPLVEFFRQPATKRLRFGDRDFAEFSAGAGDD